MFLWELVSELRSEGSPGLERHELSWKLWDCVLGIWPFQPGTCGHVECLCQGD